MKPFVFGILCGLAAGCGDATTTTETSSDRPVTVTANRPVTENTSDADNTAVNVRDRDDSSKTPLDQDQDATDVRITADIRSKVVDTEMSVSAQNVKIITEDGRVTLRGPVATEQEKQRIEEIAEEVAGENNVDSQLEVDKD
jgi:hyperosmotically inducible protein